VGLKVFFDEKVTLSLLIIRANVTLAGKSKIGFSNWGKMYLTLGKVTLFLLMHGTQSTW